MKYTRHILIACFLISYGCFLRGQGLKWQEQDAFNKAKNHIETVYKDKLTMVDLRPFQQLKKIPQNINKITNLKYLYAQGTKLSDISALKEMPNLSYVNLRGTKVRELELFNSLPNLTLLDLGKTPIYDLSPLKAPHLKRLDISETHIRSLYPTTNLPKLNWLNLYKSFADDGSKTYLDNLKAKKDIEIQMGNRFEANYIPSLGVQSGWKYQFMRLVYKSDRFAKCPVREKKLRSLSFNQN